MNEFVLTNQPAPPGAWGMRLFFGLTRSVILAVNVEGREGVETTPSFPGLEVRWSPVSDNGPLSVVVRYAGEALELADLNSVPGLGFGAIEWLTGPPGQPSGVPPDMPSDSVEILHFAAAHRLAALESSVALVVDALVEERKRGIRREPNPYTRNLLWFFFDLDHATNTKLITGSDSGVRDAVARLTRGLRCAVNRRILDLDADHHVDARCDPHEPGLAGKDLEKLSSVQRTIYTKHFPNDTRVIDVHAAYERFASGRLHQPGDVTWNARPDSVHYLLFAEFAIACAGDEVVDEGVDRDFWGPLVPVFVCTQELYLACFAGTESTPRTWGSQPTTVDVRGDVDPQQLWSFYKDLAFDELLEAHAVNAAHAFNPDKPTYYRRNG